MSDIEIKRGGHQDDLSKIDEMGEENMNEVEHASTAVSVQSSPMHDGSPSQLTNGQTSDPLQRSRIQEDIQYCKTDDDLSDTSRDTGSASLPPPPFSLENDAQHILRSPDDLSSEVKLKQYHEELTFYLQSKRYPTDQSLLSSTVQGALHSLLPGQWISSTAVELVLNTFATDGYRIIDSSYFNTEDIQANSKKPCLRLAPDEHIVVVPLHHLNHWTVAIIDLNLRVIDYYDSLRRSSIPDLQKSLIEFGQSFNHFSTNDCWTFHSQVTTFQSRWRWPVYTNPNRTLWCSPICTIAASTCW